MSAPGAGLARVARVIAIAPIVVYQRAISPAIPRRCKYEPTCSRYAVDAIGRYGILKGVVLAGWRLLRCNPWSYGGYDPVEAQQLFARRPDGRAERPAGASRKHSSPEHSHSMTAETT
jgi:putative membrane protein insertion efficiency factor